MNRARPDDDEHARVLSVENALKRLPTGQHLSGKIFTKREAPVNFIRRGHGIERFDIKIFSLQHGQY
jgi:hypothetical protein